MITQYREFIASKFKGNDCQGIEIEPEQLNPILFPYQRAIVVRALKAQRFACFADTGLGKAFIELEFAHQVCLATQGKALILAPLSVTKQIKREADKFGYTVNLVESQEQVKAGINLTNYEKLHKFDNNWDCVVLDESSCIKGYDSSLTRRLFDWGATIPYRLCATATPAPNDLIEITNHSEFLGVLRGKEVIALFFTQDGNSTVDWRLKGHARKPFYKWLATWSCAIRKPSDLGDFDDESHILPPIEYLHHEVEVPQENLTTLFAMEAQTLQEQRDAKRKSLKQRIEKTAELVNETEGYWIVWTELNIESESVTKAIPDAVELTGSQSDEVKADILERFTDGKIRVLVTKPGIAGFGLNWQHCHQMVFLGVTHSFERQYQAIRRCWRFGQTQPVQVHFVTSNLEGKIVANVQRKEQEFNDMMNSLIVEMKDFQAMNIAQRNNSKQDRYSGKNYNLFLGDSVEVIKNIEDESIGHIIFSPPFPTMYAYTDLAEDMGNVANIDQMIEQFKFLIPELERVLMPGRVCAVHLCQLLATKGRDNYIGVKDYRGRVISAFDDLGFPYAGEVCISKNPQIQATRNKERGLLFKSLATDSSVMRMALADYVLLFRKLGDNPVPIRAGQSAKYNPGGGWITEEEWIEWADPVWHRWNPQTKTGIRETDVLNVRSARDSDDERHLCLAKDSLVLTYHKGYIPIQDIEVGKDLVLTHKGRWMPVIAKQKTHESAEVVSVYATGVYGLTVTPEHKLWAKDDRNSTPDWKEAAMLEYSYVNLQCPPIEGSKLTNAELCLAGFNLSQSDDYSLFPPEVLGLDKERASAFLGGYLTGKGVPVGDESWRISSKSKALLLSIQLLILRAYGITCDIQREDIDNWILFNDDDPWAWDDNQTWQVVYLVHKTAGTSETWNIQVLEDASYTAEGCIVKNCPLQLGVIERLVKLYSNPGEIVFDPFNGIGSTGYKALELDRKYVGIELKESYYRTAIKTLNIAESTKAGQLELCFEPEEEAG